MISLFKKSNESPITEERRVWIDDCFCWLKADFGAQLIKQKRTLTPTLEDFPIDFVGSDENAFKLLDIIAAQMDLDSDLIDINFYAEGEREIVTGTGSYSRVFLRPGENEKTSAGHYKGKDEEGCFQIGLNFRSMQNVERLIATIGHELAHIKLLGEERISKNNEPLTDLTTVVFGLGIFGANAASTFETGTFSWQHGRQGYLSEMDWGYAIALNCHIREETTASWRKYLKPNPRYDFDRALRFIESHPDQIMQPKPTETSE
jgi:hypothetical protein